MRASPGLLDIRFRRTARKPAPSKGTAEGLFMGYEAGALAGLGLPWGMRDGSVWRVGIRLPQCPGTFPEVLARERRGQP